MLEPLERDEFFDEVESRIASYGIEEDISAGYFMFDIGVDRWQIIAVRAMNMKSAAQTAAVITMKPKPLPRNTQNSVTPTAASWLPL